MQLTLIIPPICLPLGWFGKQRIILIITEIKSGFKIFNHFKLILK